MDDLIDSPRPGDDPASNAPEMSVSELSTALKRTIEDAYGFVRVRGELGRVVIAKSGHAYFDIKDDRATLNSIMWKGNVSKLPFRPEEGLEVVCTGKLSTYAGRSNYQLVAETMAPAGVGALMQLLEERKKKLAAEGLFDESRKKKLPYLPSVIGVVTSPTGAVIRDILHRVRERFPVHVLIWPVLVQGERAAEQIDAGIRGFNALTPGGPIPRPDLIIVARGGGSIEDLWAFNEERVVRAAAESEIPLISAVGHETDTTLIDYVSDRRAPTPTGAAEIALPVRAELIALVGDLGGRSARLLTRLVEKRRLELRSAVGALPRADALLQAPRQRLDMAGQRFSGALGQAMARKRSRFGEVAAQLRPGALKRDVERRRGDVARTAERLRPGVLRRIDVARRLLETQGRVLDSLSYEGVLKRGFALVTGADGHLVRAAKAVGAGDALSLRFADGQVGVVASGGDGPPSGGGGGGGGKAPPKERPRTSARVTAKQAARASAKDKTKQGNLF